MSAVTVKPKPGVVFNPEQERFSKTLQLLLQHEIDEYERLLNRSLMGDPKGLAEWKAKWEAMGVTVP